MCCPSSSHTHAVLRAEAHRPGQVWGAAGRTAAEAHSPFPDQAARFLRRDGVKANSNHRSAQLLRQRLHHGKCFSQTLQLQALSRHESLPFRVAVFFFVFFFSFSLFLPDGFRPPGDFPWREARLGAGGGPARGPALAGGGTRTAAAPNRARRQPEWDVSSSGNDGKAVTAAAGGRRGASAGAWVHACARGKARGAREAEVAGGAGARRRARRRGGAGGNAEVGRAPTRRVGPRAPQLPGRRRPPSPAAAAPRPRGCRRGGRTARPAAKLPPLRRCPSAVPRPEPWVFCVERANESFRVLVPAGRRVSSAGGSAGSALLGESWQMSQVREPLPPGPEGPERAPSDGSALISLPRGESL